MTTNACNQFLTAAAHLLSAHKGVDVELTMLTASKARIDAIWSHEKRRSGSASRAMRELMALADQQCVVIELLPHWLAYDANASDPGDDWDRLHSLNEQKLNNEQLQSWYSRLGFVKAGRMEFDDPVMERLPTTARS